MVIFRKNLTPCLSSLATVSTSSLFYRLLSTPTSKSPSPTSEFAIQYLTSSCGLQSDKALRAARYLPHLKSPEKPDAVLQFLRQSGVAEPHIRAALLRDASFLVYNVEKCFKPQMAELLDIGFAPSDISLLLSICPNAFAHVTLPQKILFWMSIFGSVEKLLLVLKQNYFLLTVNLENYAIPNKSFLQEHCGLSVRQIVQLTKLAPRAITCSPEILKIQAKRAEELGFRRRSPMFVYALIVVCSLNQHKIDAKLSNLTSLGFSHSEVIIIVRKFPHLLKLREEVIGRKIGFLMKEACCDKLQVVTNPCLLTYGLEKRLIPRNLVHKLLGLKGLLVTNYKLVSFMQPSEKVFLEKFVLPYEHAIPGLHRAYADACAGNTEGLEWFCRSLQV